eukprot:716502-Prorocentrum_lima.AAC.1
MLVACVTNVHSLAPVGSHRLVADLSVAHMLYSAPCRRAHTASYTTGPFFCSARSSSAAAA